MRAPSNGRTLGCESLDGDGTSSSVSHGRRSVLRRASLLWISVICLCHAPASHAQARPHPSGDLARIAVDLVSNLRNRTTIREWRRTHPGDSVEWNVAHSDGWFNDRWCAVLHGATAMGKRDAYFYVPSPVSAMSLPVATPDLREQCQLGAVTVVGTWADSLHSLASWRADSAALSATLGAVATTRAIDWPIRSTWKYPTAWKQGEVDVRTTIARDRPDSTRAFAPFLAMNTPLFETEYQLVPPPLGHPPIDTLIALAGLRGVEASVVGDYVKLALAGDSVAHTVDSARDRRLAETLEQLVRPDPPVPPDRRIGRLLVAEWLLDSAMNHIVFWASDTIAQRLLTGLGPQFQESHMDGWWHNHFWLTEALAVGGNGPAANVAFLNAMDRGFEVLSDCGRGHQVDDVIERGTTFLASHPNSPIRGEVELMLAEGYRDMVLLGLGGGYDGDDDAKAHFAPRIGMYHREAAAHFRNAFQLVGGSPRARFDWPEAWRLIAGLGPMSAHFYCVDD